MAKYDYSKLTPEEMSEYKQLALEAGDPDNEFPEEAKKAAAPTVTYKENIGGTEFDVTEPIEAPSLAQASLYSANEGILGGFAGELHGAANSVVEMLYDDGNSYSDWSALYSRNKKIWDAQRKLGGELHPWASGASEIAGSALTMGAIGMTGAAGKALTSSVGGAAALGAVEGVGKAEEGDNMAWEAAKGAAVGATFTKLANKYLKAPSAAAITGKMDDVSNQEAIAIQAMFGMKATIKDGVPGMTSAAERVQQNLDWRSGGSRNLKDWALNVKTMPDGSIIAQKGDTFPTVYSRVKSGVSQVGSDLRTTLSSVDSMIPEGQAISKNEFFTKLSDSLVTFKSAFKVGSADLEINALEKAYADRMKLSLTDVQDIRLATSKLIDKWGSGVDLPVKDAALANANAVARSIQEEVIGKVAPEALDLFRAQNRKYGDLATALDLLETPKNAASLEPLKTVGAQIVSALKRGSQAFVLGSQLGTATAVGDAIMAAVKGGDVALNFSARRLQSLGKVRDALLQNPGKYADLASKLAQAAHVASTSPATFAHAIGYAESVIDLDADPVRRNYNDAHMKLPQILNVAKEHDVNLYSEILEAAQSGDKARLGSVLSMASRTPMGSRFIEKGVGWEGKAANSLDLQEWTAQIKQSEQPNRIKMRQLERLERFGEGPVFVSAPDFIRKTAKMRRDARNRKVPAL